MVEVQQGLPRLGGVAGLGEHLHIVSPATRYPALLPGPVQPLWQELLKKVQPALQNNVRHIPGQVDGTHMDQLHYCTDKSN